jgi:hypothetical protein
LLLGFLKKKNENGRPLMTNILKGKESHLSGNKLRTLNPTGKESNAQPKVKVEGRRLKFW